MENETSEMIVKRVSVPIGLEELMEGLSKEVLLKKPDDLYEFAARYFSKLLLLRDKTNYKVKTVRSAQTVTEQHRRLARAPYGTAPKTLSRQFSLRDHTATRRSLLRHPRNDVSEGPRRTIKPQNDSSLDSKREPSKKSSNEIKDHTLKKKVEDASEHLEPSVNKVSLSSRRPKRRYDSKRSLSRDKNESQSKGAKSSNESADTTERTENIPKRRESNSSTLSNVPSIESSEAKFNADSPEKPPKDVVEEGSAMSTPRGHSSMAKSNKVSRQEVSIATSSEERDKFHVVPGTIKYPKDDEVLNKATPKASPRSEISNSDTQKGSGSKGRTSKVKSHGSLPKDTSKTMSIIDEHSSKFYKNKESSGVVSKSQFPGDQDTKKCKNGEAGKNIENKESILTDKSTAERSLGAEHGENRHINSADLGDTEETKVVPEMEPHKGLSRDNSHNTMVEHKNSEHPPKEDVPKAVNLEAPNNELRSSPAETSTKIEDKAESGKASSKYKPSVVVFPKSLQKDANIGSSLVVEYKDNTATLKSISDESESEDNRQAKSSVNEDKGNSEGRKNEYSGTDLGSLSHKSTGNYSKKSTTGDDKNKSYQLNPDDKAAPTSSKAIEQNDHNNYISVPLTTSSEKLPTAENKGKIYQSSLSQGSATQNLVDSSSESGPTKADTNSDAKKLLKETGKSVSPSKRDAQKNSHSKSESSQHISQDLKELPEGYDKITYQNTLKHKQTRDRSSNKERQEESIKSGLGTQECGGPGSEVENSPLSDGYVKKGCEKEIDSSTENDIQQSLTDQDKSYKMAKNNNTAVEGTSSKKAIPTDESFKNDQITTKLRSQSKSREIRSNGAVKGTGHFERADGLEQNTSTSNENNTVTQPEKTAMNSTQDLSSLDVKGDERISDEKLAHGKLINSSECSTEDKSKCGDEAKTINSKRDSIQNEPFSETLNSLTPNPRTNKPQEHGVSEVTRNSESHKYSPLEDGKRVPGAEPQQLSGNINSALSSSSVDKDDLDSSKKELASTYSLNSSLSSQNRKAEINEEYSEGKFLDVQPSKPLSVKVTTSDQSSTKLSHTGINSEERTKKIDSETKTSSKNPEMTQNVNLSKQDTESVISTDPSDKQEGNRSENLGAQWLTHELMGGPKKIGDSLFAQGNAKDSNKSRGEPEEQNSNDLAQASSASTAVSEIDVNQKESAQRTNRTNLKQSESSSDMAHPRDKQASNDERSSHDVDETKIADDVTISLIGHLVHQNIPETQFEGNSTNTTKGSIANDDSKKAANSVSGEEVTSLKEEDKPTDAMKAEPAARTSNHTKDAKENNSSVSMLKEAKAQDWEKSEEGRIQDNGKKQVLYENVGKNAVHRANDGAKKLNTELETVSGVPLSIINSSDMVAATKEATHNVHQSVPNHGDKEYEDELFSSVIEGSDLKSFSNEEIKNITNRVTNETTLDSNQPVPTNDTKPGKISNVTGEADNHTYNEQNTEKPPNKSTDNKNGETDVFLGDVEIKNNLPKNKNSEHGGSFTIATYTTKHIGDSENKNAELLDIEQNKKKSSGDVNEIKDGNLQLNAPTTSNASVIRANSDSNKKVAKIDGNLHQSPNSDVQGGFSSADQTKTHTSLEDQKCNADKDLIHKHSNGNYDINNKINDEIKEGFSKHFGGVADKVVDVNENISKSAQALDSVERHELSDTSSVARNDSTQSNLGSQEHQKNASESSEKFQDERHPLDKVVDSGAPSSESDPSKHFANSHEPSLALGGKQRCDSGNIVSTKSASKERIKSSPKSSNSKIEDKYTSSDSNNSGRSSLKNGSKKSPRADNGLTATNKPEKAIRNGNDNVSSLKTGVGSKNGQTSSKKLSSPENRQQNSGDANVASMSGNSSSSGARLSKGKRDQSVDSGNNSLTTSSSEREEPKERSAILQAQVKEKEKSSSSHKKALQRSAKIEQRSSKSLSSSKSSSSKNEDKINSVESNQRVLHTEEEEEMVKVKTCLHSNSSEEKVVVSASSENSSEDQNVKLDPSVSVNREVDKNLKESTGKQSGIITHSTSPRIELTKSSSAECEKEVEREKIASSKASKIPIKINNIDSPRTNVPARPAKDTAPDTNLLSVSNVEIEKDESQKIKQKMGDIKIRPEDHKKNVSEEDRLILEKLNISHKGVENNESADLSEQGVDRNQNYTNFNDVGANSLGSQHGPDNKARDKAATIYDNRGIIDLGMQSTEYHSISETDKIAGNEKIDPRAEQQKIINDGETNLNEDAMIEHTKPTTKSLVTEATTVDGNEQLSTQSHLVTKRSAENSDVEKSSMKIKVEKDGKTSKTNVINLTLEHKEQLHPEAKGFIKQFIENEQANVYKEHCLCREVRLHENSDEVVGTSSKKYEQVVDKVKAEVNSSDQTVIRNIAQQDNASNKQSKTDKGAVQESADLVRLTLRHEEELHADVKGFIDHFIEQEEANVYKEHCLCREVRLHDTTDEIEHNSEDQLSSGVDKHTTIIQKQRSEETTPHLSIKGIKRAQSVDPAKPNGYLKNEIPTAEVKGIQAFTVKDENGTYINKSSENNDLSSRFDIAKLREELERVQDESKMNAFHTSYNPYKMRQELKQYSTKTGAASDRNNNTRKMFTTANAVLKIQSMWRGFLVRRVTRGTKTDKRISRAESDRGTQSGSEHRSSHELLNSSKIIANGGHKIPKDTAINDTSVGAPPKGLLRDGDGVLSNSSETSSSGINRSITALPVSNPDTSEKQDTLMNHSQATTGGVLKTSTGQKIDQDTRISEPANANDGQKVPKDANILENAMRSSPQGGEEVSSNEEKEVVQISSEHHNAGLGNSNEGVILLPGSKISNVEKPEALMEHSEAPRSYEELKGETEYRSNKNMHVSEILTAHDGRNISKDTQMSQSESKASSDNHNSGTVLTDGGQNASKDTQSFVTQIKTSPREPNQELSKKHSVSNLEEQESFRPSSSATVNADSEKQSAAKDDDEGLEKAATTLQSMWRGFKARKGNNIENKEMKQEFIRRKRKTEDRDMKKVSSISKEDAAALKIQSIWRAYLVRKGIDKFKSTPSTKMEKHLDDKNAAATKIQARVRGHLLRKKVVQEKGNANGIPEYRPTSIDSTDSAVTVIYRDILNDDNYDSLNYDAAIDQAAHMSLLKEEGSITEYQNKLLAQISGKSEETSNTEGAETNSLGDTDQSKVTSTETGAKEYIRAVDTDAINSKITSKTASVGTETKDVSTVSDVTFPQNIKSGPESQNETETIDHNADNAKPQTSRSPVRNEDLVGVSHKGIEGVLIKPGSDLITKDGNMTVPSQNRQELNSSHDGKASEETCASKQSYVTTKEESNSSDTLRHTGEIHDVATAPQERNIDLTKKEAIALDETLDKRNSVVEIGSNEPSDLSSATTLLKKGSRVSTGEPQGNEKPEDEKKSQNSDTGFAKMSLHHSSEMHDAILFPKVSKECDSESVENKDDSKKSKSGNNKLLKSNDSNEGLNHSSEYHDSVVIYLKSDDSEGGLSIEGDVQKVMAQEDSKSENPSEKAGQESTSREHLAVGNKDHGGVKEDHASGSPIGLQHSSELHDALVLPVVHHKKTNINNNENNN